MHWSPSTRVFSNLPCNVVWYHSWSLHSTPDFLVASSKHLRALRPLLIFSVIYCPARHWLFGIGRSLLSFFYPSLFAGLSISLHLIPDFSHILSLLITLLCSFLSPLLMFLHVLSTSLAYCRVPLLLAITSALTVLPLLLPHVFPTKDTLVGYLKVFRAPPKCSYFIFQLHNTQICIIMVLLDFVERASLYNLVNKANFLHNFS
jgi:hypothetical protein